MIDPPPTHSTRANFLTLSLSLSWRHCHCGASSFPPPTTTASIVLFWNRVRTNSTAVQSSTAYMHDVCFLRLSWRVGCCDGESSFSLYSIVDDGGNSNNKTPTQRFLSDVLSPCRLCCLLTDVRVCVCTNMKRQTQIDQHINTETG